jgi:hypothetical protein
VADRRVKPYKGDEIAELGQRHAAFLPSLPRLRLAAAALILGAAVAGAVVLSGHRVVGGPHSCPYGARTYDCAYHPRPGWVVPAMAGLVVLGLAGAAGILIATRRRGAQAAPSPKRR